MMHGALRRPRRPDRVQRAVPLRSRPRGPRRSRASARHEPAPDRDGRRARRAAGRRHRRRVRPGCSATPRSAPTAASSGSRQTTAGPSSARGPDLLCAVDAPGGLLIGTEGAHLVRVGADGLERVASFEHDRRVATSWYTPWGGPPETRSLARTDDNVLLASVHVGGIPRSDDGGRTWPPTIDIEADVHQVRALPGPAPTSSSPRRPSASAARTTAGVTWRVMADGLHATYCRAVAIAGDAVIIERVGGTARPAERALPARARGRRRRSSGSPTGSRATSTRTRSTRSTTRSSSAPAPASSGSRRTPAPPGRSSLDNLAPVTSLSLVPYATPPRFG